MKQNRAVILASASPRRKELLGKIGIKFKVKPADVNENIGRIFSLKKLKDLALRKALASAKGEKQGVVIGADTIVIMKKKIFGKPGTTAKAIMMLKKLSGTTQSVWTSVALVDVESGKKAVKACVSRVKMAKLDGAALRKMAKKNADKSGAYAIQEDDPYVKKLSGSVTNIVGFPVELVRKMLKEFEVI
ncbi:MAG: Maf family protein [Candidatus Firestonebacteria bacterium]